MILGDFVEFNSPPFQSHILFTVSDPVLDDDGGGVQSRASGDEAVDGGGGGQHPLLPPPHRRRPAEGPAGVQAGDADLEEGQEGLESWGLDQEKAEEGEREPVQQQSEEARLPRGDLCALRLPFRLAREPGGRRYDRPELENC